MLPQRLTLTLIGRLAESAMREVVERRMLGSIVVRVADIFPVSY